MQVQVSVIVAAYNEEHWLRRCLTSLKKQTLAALEVIIVDDGSTDGTATICDQYCARWPHLFRVIHQRNQGQEPARNAGITAAHGRYLGFVDADDWVEPTMYATLVATAERSHAQIVVCDVRKIYAATHRTTSLLSLPDATDHVAIATYLKYGLNNAYSGNKLYARSCWQKYRYQRMVYEDLDILLDMLSYCERVAYVQQPFYNYYKHAGSTTLDYTNPRLFDIMTAYQDAIEHAKVTYQDAVTYCVAKRILINLATPGFADYLAEFIELIRQLRPIFEASPSIMSDPAIKKVCDYAGQLTLPRRFICEREDWAQSWHQYSRNFKTIIPVAKALPADLRQRSNHFKLDYWLLKTLFEQGGLLILGTVKLHRPFGRLRAGGDVLAFEGEHCLLVGAQPRSPLISELLQQLIVGSESLTELLTMVKAQPERWSAGTHKIRLVDIKDWLQ